jgi:hypothetical protein
VRSLFTRAHRAVGLELLRPRVSIGFLRVLWSFWGVFSRPIANWCREVILPLPSSAKKKGSILYQLPPFLSTTLSTMLCLPHDVPRASPIQLSLRLSSMDTQSGLRGGSFQGLLPMRRAMFPQTSLQSRAEIPSQL